jgi:hypothetical protein
MNYISINNQKYELVEEPKCVYPPKKMWASFSSWKIKIKSKSFFQLDMGDQEYLAKIEDKFFRVKLFLTGRRELSRCRDFRIYQISCDDLRYEKVTKSEKRDLIINELFD